MQIEPSELDKLMTKEDCEKLIYANVDEEAQRILNIALHNATSIHAAATKNILYAIQLLAPVALEDPALVERVAKALAAATSQMLQLTTSFEVEKAAMEAKASVKH